MTSVYRQFHLENPSGSCIIYFLEYFFEQPFFGRIYFGKWKCILKLYRNGSICNLAQYQCIYWIKRTQLHYCISCVYLKKHRGRGETLNNAYACCYRTYFFRKKNFNAERTFLPPTIHFLSFPNFLMWQRERERLIFLRRDWCAHFPEEKNLISETSLIICMVYNLQQWSNSKTQELLPFSGREREKMCICPSFGRLLLNVTVLIPLPSHFFPTRVSGYVVFFEHVSHLQGFRGEKNFSSHSVPKMTYPIIHYFHPNKYLPFFWWLPSVFKWILFSKRNLVITQPRH